MPDPVRLPISLLVTGTSYTASLAIGSGGVPVNMLLDTGSSALAVDGGFYDPTADAGCTTTNLLQAVAYGSASFVGAVVRTAVGFGAGAPTLPGANLAV